MRRKKDPWDKPWVTIAAIVGVIAVLIIALVFFMSGGNAGGPASSAQSTSAQSTMATQVPSGSSAPSAPVSNGINPDTIKEAPTAAIPATGAFVRVSYIGGFAGTYGINGEMVSVQNSGDRVFPLNATTGTVSATFHKEDSSTRHEIVVEIYKDGKALTFGKNSSAYGLVSINSQV
ncbi:MAG: hypothetical protein Q7J03_00020 [Methanoregula sp.]|nr:hypothetical protein [Methanoregula sp.]